MYNVMFYITNKTQELFFYNRTNHSRVHQVYIGATNSCANFADKLNNCTLQQNPRLQQNWTTLKVKSIQISGGPSKTSVCPDPRIGYWSSHNSCMQEPAILHGTTQTRFFALTARFWILHILTLGEYEQWLVALCLAAGGAHVNHKKVSGLAVGSCSSGISRKQPPTPTLLPPTGSLSQLTFAHSTQNNFYQPLRFFAQDTSLPVWSSESRN